MKDYEGALVPLDQAVEKDPLNFAARYNIAFVKHTKKDHEGALAAYNQALELEPQGEAQQKQYLELLANRGALKLFMGDKESGCKDMHAAMDQGLTSIQKTLDTNCLSR